MAGHDFWDIAIPTFSGVIGALAGGIPSYVLARRASREVLERDREARRDAEKGSAHRVFVKLSILANSLLGWHKQAEEMIARADREGHSDMPVAQRLSTYAGIERETTPEFSADELGLFVSARQVAYVDDLILLQRRHRAAIDNLAAFARMKIALHYDFAERGVTTRDATGVSRTVARMPTDQANKFKLRSDELKLYARELRTLLADYARFAEQVADGYGNHVRAYFGDSAMPRLARREPDTADTGAPPTPPAAS